MTTTTVTLNDFIREDYIHHDDVQSIFVDLETRVNSGIATKDEQTGYSDLLLILDNYEEVEEMVSNDILDEHIRVMIECIDSDEHNEGVDLTNTLKGMFDYYEIRGRGFWVR